MPDDLAASLPQPPPPAPARRAAAIEAALRRFDGADGQEPASAEGRPAKEASPWWKRFPQVGALISAALVAIVGVPIAWMSFNEWSGADRPARQTESAETVLSDQMEVPPAPTMGRSAEPTVPKLAAPEAKVAAGGEAPVAASTNEEPSTAVAPPMPMEMARADTAAPPVPQARSEKGVAAPEQREVAPSSMAARAPPAFSTPQRQVAADEAAELGDDLIVVTGARRREPPARRGDWNACTVNDPTRRLRGCRNLVNPEAKGVTGPAAERVAEGLDQAWKGDFVGAVAAFDQAIEIAPRYAFAYLNRGLAFQRMGDFDRAIADLDRAVRYDPDAARGYYNRGLVLRQQGNLKRARMDEQRALDIDPSYPRARR